MIGLTVYIDSLFLINFFMNSVILFITSVMRGLDIKLIRILLSGVFSAFYGICIFFPDLSFMYSVFLRIGASMLMIYIAFGKKDFWHDFFVFLLVSSAMAGLFVALMHFTDLGVILGSVISNCIMYLNINPFIMLFGCISLYFMMEMYRRMCIKSFTCDNMLIDFELIYRGKKYKIRGLIDTGCELFEPISCSPVIVADKRIFKDFGESPIKIYIDTAAGKCGLDMLLPERIETCGNWKINQKTVIALAENGFENTRYNALINPAACSEINKERRKNNEFIKNTELV